MERTFDTLLSDAHELHRVNDGAERLRLMHGVQFNQSQLRLELTDAAQDRFEDGEHTTATRTQEAAVRIRTRQTET